MRGTIVEWSWQSISKTFINNEDYYHFDEGDIQPQDLHGNVVGAF